MTLQRRGRGDAGDTHVDVVVAGLRRAGWSVELVAPGPASSFRAHLLRALLVQLRSLRRLRDVDVVYARMHPLAAVTVAVARALGRRTFVEVNGVPADYRVAHPLTRFVRWPLAHLLSYQLRAADEVIAVTPGLAAWVTTAVGGRTAVHIVPNGADADAFRPMLPRPPDVPARYVVFVGSLTTWQGLLTGLEAATHASWPDDVALVVIGDGALRPQVERAAAAAPQRVLYLGRRAPAQVPAYVSNALLSLALKQHHDAAAGQSPLKMFESLACGVPVIGTPLHGMELVVDHRAGVLLETATPETVARTVRSLVDDDDCRRSMGVRGRQAIVAEHTWQHRVDQILAITGTAPGR